MNLYGRLDVDEKRARFVAASGLFGTAYQFVMPRDQIQIVRVPTASSPYNALELHTKYRQNILCDFKDNEAVFRRCCALMKLEVLPQVQFPPTLSVFFSSPRAFFFASRAFFSHPRSPAHRTLPLPPPPVSPQRSPLIAIRAADTSKAANEHRARAARDAKERDDAGRAAALERSILEDEQLTAQVAHLHSGASHSSHWSPHDRVRVMNADP